MPVIKTPNGKLRYKSQPLYLGVKKINKPIAKDNLQLLSRLFEEIGIEFMLSYGTLLGAVREKDFIEHDEDIDIVIKESYRNKFLTNFGKLESGGFHIVRYDRRDLYSIMREGEYIDIYFFHAIDNKLWYCSGSLIADEFMQDPDQIEFFGYKFNVHSNYIGFLECEYGVSWKTPIKWNDYDMPWIKKKLFHIKEHVKDILPDWLYFRLAKSSLNKVTKRCQSQINNYYLSKDRI